MQKWKSLFKKLKFNLQAVVVVGGSVVVVTCSDVRSSVTVVDGSVMVVSGNVTFTWLVIMFGSVLDVVICSVTVVGVSGIDDVTRCKLDVSVIVVVVVSIGVNEDCFSVLLDVETSDVFNSAVNISVVSDAVVVS